MSGDDEFELEPQDGAGAGSAGTESVAEPAALAAKQAQLRGYAKERERFWRSVLADPVGRRELWNIIGIEAHAFETKFACGPGGFPQPDATWAAHGEQMLGQRLYQTLQTLDFEGAFLMLSEHDSRFAKPKRKP